MEKKVKIRSLLICASICFGIFTFSTSCQSTEGVGGLGSIEGRVYALEYRNSSQSVESEYYIGEEDVYLVYGDDDLYSDDMKTHYDGKFRFEFLKKGKYSIYVYSKDTLDSIPGEIYPVIIDVEIDSKKDVIDLGDIVIVK